MAEDIYEMVTNEIIERLEKGVIPWHRPWVGDSKIMNLATKTPYNGINVFLLGCSGYSSPYWMTYKQAQKGGGYVKRGEKGVTVIFWKIYTTEDRDDPDKTTTIPVLKYYKVFNTEQMEGIEAPEEEEKTREFNPIETCERIVKNYPDCPPIEHKKQRACFSPSLNCINMPKPETFAAPDYYYQVLFHELTHSTGHKSKLNRSNSAFNMFGDENYSKEELVAEMGGCFLSSHAGIDYDKENSASYIAGWLRALKQRKNKKMLITAAAQAQKSTNFILGVKTK